MTFIDTNVLVYSVDGNSPDKQSVAKSIVAKAIQSPSFLVSAQVLNEFSNVSLLKLKLTPEETGRFVSVFRMIRSVALECEWTTRALEIKRRYDLQFFDSLLIAAAEANGCDEILTEDLNDGQVYCGVMARNPFR
jgi:predicted nucleic acid-binding protein